MDTRPKGASGPSLLLELEPAHRVFLRNLEDTLLSRTPPSVTTTSRPGRFWNDVFVPSGPPWSALLESFLWHLAVISVVLAVSHVLSLQEARLPRVSRHEYIVYPTASYPAIGSGGPRTPPKTRHETPRQAALRVRREQTAASLIPPSLKSFASKFPNIASARSAAPLFTPKLQERQLPVAPTSAIAPAPDINQAAGRRSSLISNSAISNSAISNSAISKSVVAPAPGLASVSERRAHAADASVVAPPPNPQGLIRGSHAPSITRSTVVEPPAASSVREKGSRSGSSLASANLVVPPPPSQTTSGTLLRGRSLQGNGIVIPPSKEISGTANIAGRRISSVTDSSTVIAPPSSVSGMESGANSGKGRQLGALPASGTQIVPPTPNIAGGLSSGKRGESFGGPQVIPPTPTFGGGLVSSTSGRASAMGAGGTVVPPVPGIAGSGAASALGRAGSSLGSGVQAVAPTQAIAAGGGASQSKLGSLAGNGLQVAPPAAANVTGSSPNARPMASSQPVPPAPDISKTSDPATIELPVRVIGLAVSLPNTSYFSNYEVFIAERRKSKTETELIKLVYISLPYQRRLSDYGFDNSKVYKLRVTRDKTCDETLLQMTWPQTDEKHSGSHYATGPPALAPGDTNSLLPCYRTTADDYVRAVTGH